MSALDPRKIGKIRYTDFLVATMDKKKLLDEELLFLTFQHFDVDSDGFINVHDLKSALESQGDASSMADIEAMIAEWDLDNNRQIDFEEFRQLIVNLKEPERTDKRTMTKRATVARKTLAKLVHPID